ncbi:hypothetical protein FTO70_14485 [Methanosarcina sp. KYL-1]|uniref:BREX system ATP-binding domain-containing protein n=1 Tax=Methanosarcina sp. KYL-1 TaxID=2602068 RepID=UPI0021017C64|nr:BREX system ATP-binding domain-containing protein [Methanosarcina sp. KYL-1]MCQ1536855.1 hypothetical protein [Methanosarcina sp. KYL-1]
MSGEIEFGSLDRTLAKRIINEVGGTGQPPLYGYQFFTAGLDRYMETIEAEYLKDYIKCGGSSFKMVVGAYGGGKTHFLYNVLGKAWEHNYITSYIELSSNSAPFHKLEEVYRAVVSNLIYPQEPAALLNEPEKGIEAVLRKWHRESMSGLALIPVHRLDAEVESYLRSLGPFESTSFQNAIKNAFLALYRKNEDLFDLIVQWLKGENPSSARLGELHIYEKIDRSTAFRMLRCLVQWVLKLGYSGLVVLLDEAEQTPSMSTRERSTLLQNLRELVDACSRGALKGTMVFYAVPDEGFLEGRTHVYEALNQRLSTTFEGEINPTGVRIDLENLSKDPVDLLREIGAKLAKIYEVAYAVKFDEVELEKAIREAAEKADQESYGEIAYNRLFVQLIVPSFHALRTKSRESEGENKQS